MRKISILLVLSMCLGLFAGCNQNADKKEESSETSSETDIDMGYEDEDYVDETLIRENGSLPNDVEKLTKAEFSHYLGIVITALKELDIETLKEYYKPEEKESDSWVDDLMNAYRDHGEIECLEYIKNDETMRNLWEYTVGQMIYLPDSGYVAYKDTQYLFCKWYNDMLDKGESLPNSTWDLSIENILAIYEEYDKELPYNTSLAFDVGCCFVEDGNIYFKLDSVINRIFGLTLMCVEPDEEGVFSASEYSYLAFGATYYLENEIATDEDFNLLDIALEADLDKVVEYFDSRTEYDLNTMDDYKAEDYRTYFKDDAMRAKAQQWMNENVNIFNRGNWVVFYMPLDMEYSYPCYSFSEEERELVKDITLVEDVIMYDESNDEYDFSPYYDLIDRMKEFDVFEE